MSVTHQLTLNSHPPIPALIQIPFRICGYFFKKIALNCEYSLLSTNNSSP
ncbi:hypothetical protein XNC1_4152 [Xenorhabdus nematophila ATCC 19061]|uniref:Uncharacterized protein n=1 Tax=Xenorhabdus nematophila (strain ATCC 19061 / DSM 3370 / CCUG 14189 / LMG 1036 / NCIMB 9965 / AN6) TaxID=406817 RepID=D3VDD7_XENNA|nr:hypothetical protein XNC1_4152 [Xenorhabdus nematophila ATCC 19061]CEF28984.1 hypothetical protein XNW1_1470020 [Xenorhabdus nematophila str. Websteri]CEF33719.1 hypothetical protein XNW1_4900019 [Xenorhabdus nematophila str. Websteri]CEK24992.1 hypothetical protein XNC2_4005 [Xenorhabdus nematophila AN6/1]